MKYRTGQKIRQNMHETPLKEVFFAQKCNKVIGHILPFIMLLSMNGCGLLFSSSSHDKSKAHDDSGSLQGSEEIEKNSNEGSVTDSASDPGTQARERKLARHRALIKKQRIELENLRREELERQAKD